MKYQEFYETHYQDVRDEQLKRIYPQHFRPKKKLPTTIEREKREARYEKRSNICTECFLVRPCEC